MTTYLTEDGSRETGDDTGRQGDAELRSLREVLTGFRAHGVIDRLRCALVDCELADSVRDLLAQNGDEPRVEPTETLGAKDLGETRPETIRVLQQSQQVSGPSNYLGVGNQTDASRFSGGQEDVGEEPAVSGGGGMLLTRRWLRPRGKSPYGA